MVETNGLNDLTPLDGLGHLRSESTRITERYRRRDFGHMDVEVTFQDSTLYTHPFSIHFTDLLEPDSDMLENFCSENERDKQHMKSEKRSFLTLRPGGRRKDLPNSISDFNYNDDTFVFTDVAINAAPEPFSFLLMGSGLAAFGLLRRKRR